MALLRCFYTAVPLQCRVLETGGECTELVMRLDFMVVHAAVCLAGTLPEVMAKTCVLTQQMVRVVFSEFLQKVRSF